MSWSKRRREARHARRDALVTHLRHVQVTNQHGLVSQRKSAVRASLVEVDLQDADLRWSDLREADLRDADLRGAKLDGADLSWAILSGARLNGVRFGTARVVEAIFHGAVRWPSGFSPSEPGLGGPLIHGMTKSTSTAERVVLVRPRLTLGHD